MRFSSSSAIPSRVTTRLSGVLFTRISLFCREITTERRLGSLACGFSGVSGVPPIVSTSEVQPAIRQDSITNEKCRKNLANVFMLVTFMRLLLISIPRSFYSLLCFLFFVLYFSFFIFFRFFLAFSGSTPSALRNHSSAFFRSPSR